MKRLILRGKECCVFLKINFITALRPFAECKFIIDKHHAPKLYTDERREGLRMASRSSRLTTVTADPASLTRSISEAVSRAVSKTVNAAIAQLGI